jgi:hypothetical protein
MLRTILIVIQFAIGVSAVAGAVSAFSGAPGVPGDWLRDTPFRSCFVPRIVPVVMVAGSMFAAAGLLIAGSGAARLVSLEAGVFLLGLIGVQVSLNGLRHWLQPVMGVLAAVVVVASFMLPSPG